MVGGSGTFPGTLQLHDSTTFTPWTTQDSSSSRYLPLSKLRLLEPFAARTVRECIKEAPSCLVLCNVDEPRGAESAGFGALNTPPSLNFSCRMRTFCSRRGWGWYRVTVRVVSFIGYLLGILFVWFSTKSPVVSLLSRQPAADLLCRLGTRLG